MIGKRDWKKEQATARFYLAKIRKILLKPLQRRLFP